jgi:hypothetical protein
MKRVAIRIALLALAHPAGAQEYIVHDFGPTGDFYSSSSVSLRAINSQHGVIGYRNSPETLTSAVAFNFPGSQPPRINGAYLALNNRGDIVGEHAYGVWGNQEASQAVAVIDGNVIDIQPRPGPASAAFGINEQRVIVGKGGVIGGFWTMNLGTQETRSVLAPDGSTPTKASGINNRAQVTGVSGKRGFLWDPVAGSTWIDRPQGVDDDLVPGRVNALGMLPLSGTATGSLAGDDISGIVMPDGSFVNFSLLTGARTSIAQLSDTGVAVGHSNKLAAFVWDAQNGIRSLNDLIPPLETDGSYTHGYVATSAISISDDGWILVQGISVSRGPFFDHSYPVYMALEPVPAPGAWALLGGAVVLAGRRRR